MNVFVIKGMFAICAVPKTDNSLLAWVVGKAVPYCSDCGNKQSNREFWF